MAFGKHWEWRGFGDLSPQRLARVRQLPLLFERSQEVVDRYLWAPGCELNVKLRFGDFKIKRLISRAGRGVEEWLEDPAENHSFPIAASVVSDVAKASSQESSA